MNTKLSLLAAAGAMAASAAFLPTAALAGPHGGHGGGHGMHMGGGMHHSSFHHRGNRWYGLGGLSYINTIDYSDCVLVKVRGRLRQICD